MHHSYCHVICQDPFTCYQLVVMAHNVMLSVPSLAAECQGVLRGETPQLEYGHDQEKEVVKTTRGSVLASSVQHEEGDKR